MTVLTVLNSIANVALYPSRWLHETTHLAAWRPWTQEVVDRDYAPRQGHASAVVALDEDMPRWAYYLGSLAPTIVGGLAAVAAILVSLASGQTLPQAQGYELAAWYAIAAYWFTFTCPSRDDLQRMPDAGASPPEERDGARSRGER